MEEIWDYDKIEIMKDEDDYLKLIKILFVEFYINKHTQLCTCIILAVHVPLWAAQFYYYAKSFNLYFLMQYAPASLVFLYGFSSMVIPILYEKDLKSCIKKMNLLRWSFKHADIEIQKYILQKAKLFRNIAIINIILGLLTYICLLLRAAKGISWEILFQVTFLKQNFPEHATFLIIIFYVSIIYFIPPMLTMAYMFSYFIWQLYFQALIVTKRIKDIRKNYRNDVELISDDTYQQQIFHRLRFCIIRWIQLKNFSLEHLAIVPVITVVYAIMAILVVICYLSSWYFDPEKYYPLFIFITITSAYTGLVVAEAGQIIEDESMEMYSALMFLPWYTFNKKNMKMYLIILSYATVPVSASPLETLPINRRLIVQIYKVLSSISALLANSKEKLKWG